MGQTAADRHNEKIANLRAQLRERSETLKNLPPGSAAHNNTLREVNTISNEITRLVAVGPPKPPPTWWRVPVICALTLGAFAVVIIHPSFQAFVAAAFMFILALLVSAL